MYHIYSKNNILITSQQWSLQDIFFYNPSRFYLSLESFILGICVFIFAMSILILRFNHFSSYTYNKQSVDNKNQQTQQISYLEKIKPSIFVWVYVCETPVCHTQSKLWLSNQQNNKLLMKPTNNNNIRTTKYNYFSMPIYKKK